MPNKTKDSPEIKHLQEHHTRRKDRFAPKELKKQPLWHRQTGESAEAYQAFAYFLMLPQEERTHKKTAESVGKSVSTMNKWARQWSWRIRAAAYEEHYLLLRLESIEADRDAMWLEQKGLAMTAITIVEAHFKNLINKMDDGETLNEMGHDSVVKLFSEALKAQRMAVLGRTESAEKAQEANERLAERWADELADLMRSTADELNLTDEQKVLFQSVIAKHLLGQEAEVSKSGTTPNGRKVAGAGRKN